MSRFLVRVVLGVFVLFVLACLGIGVPLDLAIAILFGWAFYLVRVLPEVQVNGWGVATACVCLVTLAVGLHVFLDWVCRSTTEVVARRWRWRWTGGLIGLVVLMFVSGLAVGGVAHQVGWMITSRERWVVSDGSGAARRAQSMNNLKQIGLALYNYESGSGTFPPAATFDRGGRPLQSWLTSILPYLEREDLFERIDLSIPWDDPRNASAFRTEINAYQNPRIAEHTNQAGYALSHYAGNVRMMGGDVRWTIRDVTDGSGNTMMAGEVVSRFKPWGDPINWRDPAPGINRSADGFGSPFPGGANFLFADGSVHFIKDTVAPEVIKALSTPKGGERVSSEQY